MPVLHMRIDNRLIHGQVTVSWVSSYNADRIIVTNDKVAQDPVQKMLLPQAARGVNTSVFSIDETLDHLKSEKGQKEKIIVIAKNPEDALRLLEGGLEANEINVGNHAPVPGTKYKMVTKSIAVTPEDAEVYRKIAEKGYDLTSRMMPSDRHNNFLELLKKNGL